MTIKFSASAANQYLSMVDSAGLTYPAGDFCLSWIMSIDSNTLNQTQYLISNGPYQSAGSVNVAYLGGGANNIVLYGQADTLTSATTYASGVRLFVFQRTLSGGVSQVSLRSSPILSAFPTTAASVVVDTPATNFSGTSFDGSGGIVIAGRSDLNPARFCDQSLGRVFRYDGQLTDLEVAKLAYGMEITDLGHTPMWYVKMETASDTADRGSLANAVTPHGSFVTGTAPAFGYTGAGSAPVITSNPVIVGGANVGSASSVTPGSTTGTPTPTSSYQWNIDGVAISGATSTTYTPVSSDAGKTLTVTQTATNGVGSPATATSSGVVVAAATSTIDVTQLIAERVYQRTGVSAAIPLTGTYTNTTPTSIEYQLYAADGVTVLVGWTAISGATISGGNWSGTPSISTGGPYRLAVRSKSGTTVLATSNIKANLFMVGGDMYATGSSSANRWFFNNSGTGFTPNANVRQASSTGWSVFGTDGCAIKMANSFATQGSIPIGMVNCGVEGETLANWLNMSGSSWTNFANTLAANGGKMELLLMAMGSNDAANGIVVSRAQHAANLRQFISNVRALTGQPNLPVVISGFNGRPGATAQQADFVRMAENDVGGDANVSAVQIVDLPLSGDNIHLTPAGFTTSGDRITYVQGRRMYGDGTYLRGPKETAITYTSSVIKIALQHRNGTDFTPTTGIGGYVFTDDSGALPLTSAVRSAANEITITPSRPIVGVPVGTYLSGSGQAPSNSVIDNGAMSLPMNVETSMVATQAATGDTTAPTLTGASATTTGPTTASGSVTTNEANGTLYYLASTSATATAAQVKAGASQTVTATGAQSVSFTGLSPTTQYYPHYLHTDAAGNDSTVLDGAAFTTQTPADTTAPTLSAATAAPNGAYAATGSVTTNEGNGTLYYIASVSASLTAAQVKAGSAQAISSAGAKGVAVSGLAAATIYYLHFLHRDAAGNDSAVLRSASFTTAAAPTNPSTIDATKVPASRTVTFPGNKRVVTF